MTDADSSKGNYQCAYCGDLYSETPFNMSHALGSACCGKWRCRAKRELDPGVIPGLILILLYIGAKEAYIRLRGLIPRD